MIYLRGRERVMASTPEDIAFCIAKLHGLWISSPTLTCGCNPTFDIENRPKSLPQYTSEDLVIIQAIGTYTTHHRSGDLK